MSCHLSLPPHRSTVHPYQRDALLTIGHITSQPFLFTFILHSGFYILKLFLTKNYFNHIVDAKPMLLLLFIFDFDVYHHKRAFSGYRIHVDVTQPIFSFEISSKLPFFHETSFSLVLGLNVYFNSLGKLFEL